MAFKITRSPNYPSMHLGDSIEAVRKVYAEERRSKFPRTSLAAHLGYSSLNGRALSKIGAIRAYGLIDGREDTLSVSPTAIALLEAPKDSEDFKLALHEAFNAPPLFARIAAEHEETPSPQTLRWWLAKQGYIADAADKALKVYLDSLEVVNSYVGEYDSPAPDAVKKQPNAMEAAMSDFVSGKAQSPYPAGQKIIDDAKREKESLAMGVQERVLTSGLLSKTANFRVIVSGPVGEKEIERLVRKLEMDKEILADPDPNPDTEAAVDAELDPFA